jgi:hypothetical protein
MSGGVDEVKLELQFMKEIDGGKQEPWAAQGVFYAGEISEEMILGYPWLAENSVGILAGSGELTVGWPQKKIVGCTRESEKTNLLRGVKSEVPLTRNEFSDGEDWLTTQKMRLKVISVTDGWESKLEDAELEEVQMRLTAVNDETELLRVRRIQTSGSSEWGQYQSLVEELRAGLHADYDGTVLVDEIDQDPPVRGPHCEGKIFLKPGAKPKKQGAMKLQGERLEGMKKVAQDWFDGGRIEHCQGPWASPSFAVPTKTPGKLRGVVDLRYVNEQCEDDSYPLPRIEELLVEQGKRQIHSVMDLKDGFHQIPLAKESRVITGTNTPLGLMQWKVVVMGWKNGVQYCQRNVEASLRDVQDVACGYVDDILVGTPFGEEEGEDVSDVEAMLRKHERDLRRVLEACKQKKLQMSHKKCQLFVKEVEFCGHLLSGGVRKPAPGKLLALAKWELPQTAKALRGFLGFTNYYAGYVQNYAHLAGPLQDMLKKKPGEELQKNPKVEWNEERQKAFNDIKRALQDELQLHVIDVDKPFIVRTDASGKAVGAVLEQPKYWGQEKKKADLSSIRETVTVGFMSRKLAGSQLKWDVRDKEAYAVVCALDKFEGAIGLQPVVVLTDHKSLEHWATEVVSSSTGQSGKRARWHQRLSRFDLQVAYVPGKDHVVADAMSRWAYPASQSFADVSWHGSAEDTAEMEKIMQEERREERGFCQVGVSGVEGSWKTEEYKVSEERRRDIVRRLGLEEDLLQVDVFANEKNKQFPLYCSKQRDAFKYDWASLSTGGTWLWANPPFSLLMLVLAKHLVSTCRIVLVVPVWPWKCWFGALERLAEQQVCIPACVSLYESDGGQVLPGRWETRVMRIDMAKVMSRQREEAQQSIPQPVWRWVLGRTCWTLGDLKRHVWGQGWETTHVERKIAPVRTRAQLNGEEPEILPLPSRRRRAPEDNVRAPEETHEGNEREEESWETAEDEELPPCDEVEGRAGGLDERETIPGSEEAEGVDEEAVPEDQHFEGWENDEDVHVEVPGDDDDMQESATTRGSEREPTLTVPISVQVHDRPWDDWYASCPKWGRIWRQVQEGVQWVTGIHLDRSAGRMLFHGKECVPWAIIINVVSAWHELKGHVGVEKH